MTADAFTRASPLYRRAQAKGSRPLPLAFGEVATYGRQDRSTLWLIALCLAAAAVIGAVVVAVNG